MDQWRPIETAPKDGTIVLLGGGTWGDDELAEAPRSMSARYYERRWDGRLFSYWVVFSAEAGHSLFPYENPTHWQPMPSGPVA
jgi:hypothetical protein